MNYLSVCSGIEAASVAWQPLGWDAVGFSETERFPCSVLKYHYPEVPNFGDMTKHEEWPIKPGSVDVLIGGTPCQSFSVAGLRKGLADPRGNLALVYLALVDRIRPRYVVWENVPGVLSSNKGRDFGSFLGGLVELGYGFAYRVLDAQYWGVAQRRRRVFVVGCLGNWQRAASVLFERESCTRNTPARQPQGPRIAADLAPCLTASGRGTERVGESRGQDPLIACMAQGQANAEVSTDGISPVLTCDHEAPIIAHTLTAQYGSEDGTGRGLPLVAQTITKNNASNVATAGNNCGVVNAIISTFGVRRLTPTECERLQGFPDGYTNIPKTSDGPRYRALGNSMAVPVIRWIGERIQTVDALKGEIHGSC